MESCEAESSSCFRGCQDKRLTALVCCDSTASGASPFCNRVFAFQIAMTPFDPAAAMKEFASDGFDGFWDELVCAFPDDDAFSTRFLLHETSVTTTFNIEFVVVPLGALAPTGFENKSWLMACLGAVEDDVPEEADEGLFWLANIGANGIV